MNNHASGFWYQDMSGDPEMVLKPRCDRRKFMIQMGRISMGFKVAQSFRVTWVNLPSKLAEINPISNKHFCFNL